MDVYIVFAVHGILDFDHQVVVLFVHFEEKKPVFGFWHEDQP